MRKKWDRNGNFTLTVDGIEYLATPITNSGTGYVRLKEKPNDIRCADAKQIESNKRADKLWSDLRSWQAIYDKPVDTRNTKLNEIYFIAYDIFNRHIKVGIKPIENTKYCSSVSSTVYFSSIEIATQAIEEHYAELSWFFNEYTPRLDIKS